MGLIVAIDDLDSFNRVTRYLHDLCSIVDGFKLGIPMLLSTSPRRLESMRLRCEGLMIADLKLADIGAIMIRTVKTVENYFNAVIAHSFIGVEGALGDLKRYLDDVGLKLILVASMSHPGSQELYDTVLEGVLDIIRRVEPWGVVAPATRPNIIRRIRGELGDSIVILSPGVGVQGAKPGDAICSGADYEIVGRLITGSRDVVGEAYNVKRRLEERGCA